MTTITRIMIIIVYGHERKLSMLHVIPTLLIN
jgi:hypothetical protein